MGGNRPLRAVISGAGASGCLHALAYRAAGVAIVGIFDVDPVRAAALADLCGATAAATEKELFARDADVASICSPPPAHAAQAVLASRSSRIVLVEKPVATTAADFACVERLPGCVPILQWRAGRGLRALRAAVLSGHLGESPSVSCDLSCSRGDAYFEAGRATLTAWGGGVLLSVAIHALDAICFAIGRGVTRVSGWLSHRPNLEVETAAAVTLAFEGGALASLRATFDGACDATRLCFAGNGVTASIDGSEVDPTAGCVSWAARDPVKLRALQALEARCSGGLHSPLVIPFIHNALDALTRGGAPGECDSLPSVRSTRAAHTAVFDVYTGGRAVRSPC